MDGNGSTAAAVRTALDELPTTTTTTDHVVDWTDRLLGLFELARRRPVHIARLVEAHLDATAILGEAGRRPVDGAIYGVWASTGGSDGPSIHGGAVDGTKRFCSGLGIVDRALMTVSDQDGRQQLLDVDVTASATVSHDTSGWATAALAQTSTGSATFTEHHIDVTDAVESPGWYLSRPGFWHGACAPAACWAGATAGVVDAAARLADDDPHRRAHLGAMVAAVWTMRSVLHRAGEENSAGSSDADAAEMRARSVRHTVERTCTDVLDRFDRAFGPRPTTSDPEIAQRVADIRLYLRQHHGERELGALARFADTDGLQSS